MNEPRQSEPLARRVLFTAAMVLAGLFAAACVLAVAFPSLLAPRKKVLAPPLEDAVDISQPEQPAVAAALAEKSPFLNTHAGVAYIADQRCDECHAEIAVRYRQHPMGRSIRVLDAAAVEEEAEIAPVPTDSFTLGGFEYEVDYSGGRVQHREKYLDAEGKPAATITKEIAYAVGAGARGRSYLVRDGNHLLMSPLTWYPGHQEWALSPGYEKNHSHFYRPVIGGCLFCHAGQANWEDQTRNRYSEPILPEPTIGCQRCHGPGSLHVARQVTASETQTIDSENFDPTIVNPAHLSDALALDVCAQCHLSGTARVVAPGKKWNDFRPGLRLSDFIAIYVEKDPAKHHFVGHAEQMRESQCFVKSQGKLRCTSCHDPHGVPAPDMQTDFYRQRCNACHGEGQTQCSEKIDLREAKQDNCLACHMPALSTEIAHAAVTDHRILPRPEDQSAPDAGPPLVGVQRLAPFDRSVLSRLGYPLQRNIGLAVVMAGESADPKTLGEETESVRLLLEQAVRQDASDFAAREGLASAYERLRQPAEALAQYEQVLQDHPQREFSLSGAARQMMELNRFAEAASYWEQAEAVNPTMPLYRAEHALALARQHKWAECEQLCRTAVEKFPDSFACRQLLVESSLGLGKMNEANDELATLIRLQPSSTKSLRAWFDKHPLRSEARD